jgi:hypothetical protein
MSDVAVATPEGFAASAEIALANAIAAGNHDAFLALMRRFNGLLYRTARSIVQDDLAAEDVVQNACVLAHRKIGNFRGKRGCRSGSYGLPLMKRLRVCGKRRFALDSYPAKPERGNALPHLT